MCYHEDIEIDGSVSEILYFHIVNYVAPLLKDFRPHYSIPTIKVNGYADAKKSDKHIVGTGFSGGVDSFCTIYDRFELEKNSHFKLNTLFFFNIGQNGHIDEPSTAIRAKNRFEFSKQFADSVGLPMVFMDTNMFLFYKSHWEYDAGPLCRSASILVFQRVCDTYFLASSYHYRQHIEFESIHHLDDMADPYIYYQLSTSVTHIILDGAQYYRDDKVERLLNYPPVYKFLNVCIKGDDYVTTKNCSCCHKCHRTLYAIQSLGKLDDFSEVFDIPLYLSHEFAAKCDAKLAARRDPFTRKNIEFAESHGNKFPSYPIAWLYAFPARLKNKIMRMLHRK
jgi:hypothetical protein